MGSDPTIHLDDSALVITYCDGIGCNASTKGAPAMTKHGFRVKELMGGLDWRKRDGYPVAEGDRRDLPGAGDDRAFDSRS
jgi:rhodanese-related sulfurtransferase